MTDKNELLVRFEAEYLHKVLGFCILKLSDYVEAEDLAQEIALEVIKTIRRAATIDNLNALVWSISNHIFCKYLRKKKGMPPMEYLPEMVAVNYSLEGEVVRREEERLLHREIARLASNYRNTIIMYYFNGLNCRNIAKVLGTSEGTVKWWLYEARKEIREGMNTMREYGEKSYSPGVLFVSCQGDLGLDKEPISCARRKSAQNILLAAYKKAVTMQELSDELGISMPYIEDEVDYLTKNQLMKREAGGKYRTDFVILPNSKIEEATDELYEACFPAYYETLMHTLEKRKETLVSPAINRVGFGWSRLLWVYVHLFTEAALDQFRPEETFICYDNIPLRPNGGKWIAIGYENDLLPGNESAVKYTRRHPMTSDGPVMRYDGAQSFYCDLNGWDSNVFFSLPQGIFNLCRSIILGEKSSNDLSEEEKYLVSTALEKKLLIRDTSGFRPNFFCTDCAAYAVLYRLANEFYAEAKPYFKKAYDLATAIYLREVPGAVQWQAANLMTNVLNAFVSYSCQVGVECGTLCTPDADNRDWIMLFA